jgi:hypothetical protein
MLLRRVGALRLDDITVPAAVNGGAVLFADVGGFPRFKPDSASGDTNTYMAGHFLKRSNITTPINSTSPIQIDNLTFTVGPGDYHVHGTIIGVNAAAGVLQPQGIRFEGTCAVSDMRVLTRSAAFAVNSVDAVGNITAMNADPDNNRTPALSEAFTIELDGWIHVMTAGTFLVQGRNLTSNADASWTAQADSYCGLWPAV